MSPFERSFDELREGERFATRGRTVTEADVVLFAGLSGDTHPQHTDAEWSAGSRFGERIAHGMLVLSYAVGLMSFDPERVVALRRVTDVVFKQPARIGDTIRVEGEVADRRELDDDHGLVTCRWRIINQRQKLVARATVEVVWRRESSTDPEPETAEPDRQPVLI
jgi:3-hydroxybutyryl-CoA dehydratase